MTDREKKLLIAVAALLVGVGIWWGWGEYQQAADARRSGRDSARSAVRKAKLEKAMAMAAAEELSRFRDQSLPADYQTAQTDYRDWLLDRMEAAGLAPEDITIGDSRPEGEHYATVGFSVDARGDLDSVVRFLHAYYDANLLHKITSISLTPQGRDQLAVAFGTQALVVNGTPRKAELPEGQSGRPLLAGPDAYAESIGGRNLFARYTPPPPPRPPAPPRPKPSPPPPKPKFDAAAHAYITGIVQSGDRLQAWITVRTTGEVLRLFAGDELRVGLLEGVVESIEPRRIVVRVGEERFAASLGENLRAGEKLL